MLSIVGFPSTERLFCGRSKLSRHQPPPRGGSKPPLPVLGIPCRHLPMCVAYKGSSLSHAVAHRFVPEGARERARQTPKCPHPVLDGADQKTPTLGGTGTPSEPKASCHPPALWRTARDGGVADAAVLGAALVVVGARDTCARDPQRAVVNRLSLQHASTTAQQQ